MNSTARSSTPDDEITLGQALVSARRILATVYQQRHAFVAPTAVVLTIGILIATFSPSDYRAQTKLVPYGTTAGASGLSGIAGLAGITLRSPTADAAVISADLYPDLARTHEFLEELARTPIVFSDRDSAVTLVDYYGAKTRRGRDEAAADSPSIPKSSTEQISRRHPRIIEPSLAMTTEKMSDRVSVQSDKKTGVVTVAATMPDPVAAAQLAQAAADLLMRRVTDFEVRKADEQIRFLSRMHDESKSRYDSAQRALAGFADRNRILMSASAQIERTRLEREVEISFGLFQQFSRELENARVKRNQDTPVFAVLEEVTIPTRRLSPRRGRIIVLSLILGLLIGGTRVWWRQVARREMALATSTEAH